MTQAAPLSAEQARQILQTIATSKPDYAAWAAQFADNATTRQPLPPELVQDVLAVLAEDPQQAVAIKAMSNHPGATRSFFPGGEVATLLAVAFVLRTHIRIKRSPSGKWEFLIEHKPADSKLLGALLKKLEDWLGENGTE